jgi:hypothetical protein
MSLVKATSRKKQAMVFIIGTVVGFLAGWFAIELFDTLSDFTPENLSRDTQDEGRERDPT